MFLVESKDSHKNCVLLLDEAGTSLHPMGQKDLLNFFENLSITNQIITTTHSPFLVDVNHLERTKVVFVDDKEYTKVSEAFERWGEKEKCNRSCICGSCSIRIICFRGIVKWM
ncbi:MAG: AAA family ATPase [Veillonella sp.]|nr:AAA family ATPase [Veillonella sp.]